MWNASGNFVEAKGLGEDLADRRWVSQVVSYAAVAGVTWCVVTDGDEYRFYNAAADGKERELLDARSEFLDSRSRG